MSVDWTEMPASWSRVARRAIPPSLLLHSTGTQNPANKAVATPVATHAGDRRLRSMTAIAIVATVAPVAASRAVGLSQSGPPGKRTPTRMTTANVARAATADSLRLGPLRNGVASTTTIARAVIAAMDRCAGIGMKYRFVRLPT